ncbi:hypothetical protein MU582_00070 [Nocardioidaceae bacterium SCSIO 66511]|nr:hypothetical protein MU582_00070 [Nocardioidaceae bacterium SCSIO 66511]
MQRTTQPRMQVRRWSRWETVAQWILLVGAVALVAAVVVGIGLVIGYWVADIDRPEIYFWMYGSSIGVLLVGVALHGYARTRLTEARFADAQRTVGVIEEVIELPSDVDGNSTYDLTVRAELPGHTVLRRTIGWGSGDAGGPDESWIGRAIRIRHNTVDPESLHDAVFDGFPEADPR